MAARKREREKDVAAVVEEAKGVDLVNYPSAWSDLDVLSGDTHVDAIEIDPAGVSVAGDSFRGVANVYVVLEYGGGQGPEGFTDTGAFLGKFEGHFDEHRKPVIDNFTVDTSPFYAGEEAAG